MRKYRLCPKCGHSVFGGRCKWCNYVLPPENTTAAEEAEPQEPQVIEVPQQAPPVPAARVEPEAAAKSNQMVVMDAQQKARRILYTAEQNARELANKTRLESDARAAEIIASAQQ